MKTLPSKWASRAPVRKKPKGKARESDYVLELVREGVRRFIQSDVPIGEFQKTIRAAARNGKRSSHPLTGPVFRQIVRQAIRERKDTTREE